MEILAKLGIDWKLLVAQLVNFAILLFVLHRFAYRPMLDMLENRSKRIEKGLQDAEKAKRRLSEIAEKEKEVLRKAREEAKGILAQAEEAGRQRQEKMFEDAQLETARMLTFAKSKMESEQARMMAEAKAELAGIVVTAVERVVNEKLDAAKDGELIHKALREVKQS